MKRSLALASALFVLTACSSAPKKDAPPASVGRSSTSGASSQKRSPYAPAQEDPSKRGDYTAGGLYAPHIQDSAPDDLPDIDSIPEPEVKAEPRSRYGNRSYSVLGKSYRVLESADGYLEQGMASYYGKKFHGRRTSNLEVFDMYAFSAAHKSLPLPSYARVTNLANGKSVVVRVNDRGPFHAGRIIDLSYAAAVKLGMHRTGTARVEVRGLRAGDTKLAGQSRAGSKKTAAAPSAEQRAPGSAIDTLVDALPIGSANAGERVPSAPAKGQEWRFDMRQDGRVMTADEFDAWMKSRSAQVATGKPGRPGHRESESAAVVSSSSSASKPVEAIKTSSATKTASGVTLQLAAFAARDNAERALAMVRDAGIDAAHLQDGKANGQPVWRLRVGPVASALVPELTARFTGLGFGQPQLVRE